MIASSDFDISTIERAVPVLPGDDLRVAKDFYVAKLGFNVEWEATEDGSTGLIGLRRGTIELTIDCPMSGHGRHACVSLRVNSADALYQEWRQAVEIGRPPDERAVGWADVWGQRSFRKLDLHHRSRRGLSGDGPSPDAPAEP